MHFGIDYGSKLSGTTVITYDLNGILFQKSSAKKMDADAMILKTARELKPSFIYLDAPLSLPKIYSGKGNDYFYREADRELKAMSPMFLGGLTARAMQLKAHILSLIETKIFETYPGALVRSIPELKICYKKKDPTMIPVLTKQIEGLLKEIKLNDKPKTIHEIDSILAWYSGLRHQNGDAVITGNLKEGVIIY
jgi:predicted nuclease with RNAse H fold